MRFNRVFFVIALGVIFAKCSIDNELENEIYNFSTAVNVNYKTDTIPIGDTLWIKSEIQGFLNDSASKRNIHFTAANIKLNLMVRSWSNQNQINQSEIINFDFRTPVDFLSFTEKTTMLGFKYVQDSGIYKLHVGIGFKNAGIYSIDSDYLIYDNFYSADMQYLGGGVVEINDLSGVYKSGYLKANLIAENRNMHLYESLSVEEKGLFQEVNSNNENKYYFIKVLE